VRRWLAEEERTELVAQVLRRLANAETWRVGTFNVVAGGRLGGRPGAAVAAAAGRAYLSQLDWRRRRADRFRLPEAELRVMLRRSRFPGLNQTSDDRKVEIIMQQSYGCIRADGTVDSGSGDFSVTRTGPGMYEITFNGRSSSDPIVVVTPQSTYLTARAVSNNTSPGRFRVLTGYSDQGGSTNYMDIDFFHFVAIWP
jgi:hypothetical protein